MQFVFKSSGTYFGFISNGFLYSRDGEYLGWLEGLYVWDTTGRFRGQLWQSKYVIINRFAVTPVPRPPRTPPSTPPLPNPQPNIAAVALPTGWIELAI